jgi:V-type H+-transporting ATPase subunit E
LQQRQQYLNELFQEGRARLQTISKDKAAYASFLRDLLLQSFFKLMERNVTIQCRQADLDLVSKAAVEAKAAYEANPKIANSPVPQLEVTLDRENFISESMTGGVVVHAIDGRIRVDNTLEARLEQLNELMLPQIRLQLYGPSPNRKFFD